MLAGGTHSMIHPFGVTGFNLLTALSESNDEPTKASRPFDRLRNGFVLGEGSAMVVLEELEAAKARGANIYGEIAGYGTTADAYRITDIPLMVMAELRPCACPLLMLVYNLPISNM